MGQSESKPEHKQVPIEQFSHELALQFASKCYSHLEITHYKDNFKTLADHQDGVEYWKEETLCRFLCIPDSVHAGSVLYAMTTYLGAFPFPSLAPCIVTREAMLKVVTILTGRYKKVLKRGDQDKNKLLFRSLAIFDRSASSLQTPAMEKSSDEAMNDSAVDDKTSVPITGRGFAIDEPADNEEDEDDDDLALAALDALDAIEVFKEDHRVDRKIHHAHIPVQNLERLLMLLLLFTPLSALDNIALITENLSDENLKQLKQSASALVAAFNPDREQQSITYSNFIRTMTMITKELFRPFNPLFEHFLFSRQLDLSKSKTPTALTLSSTKLSPIDTTTPTTLLNDILLAQLDTSLSLAPSPSTPPQSLFHSSLSLHLLYSTSTHGTSLSSFSRQILSWRSPTILILSGINPATSQTHILGASLPTQWHDSSNAKHPSGSSSPSKAAALFQLVPRHTICAANPFPPSPATQPQATFSSHTGLALGCILPSTHSSSSSMQPAVPGPVSLLIDDSLSTCTFTHDAGAGTGTYLTDPRFEEAQRADPVSSPRMVRIEIDTLEVWGVTTSTSAGEVEAQRRRLEWEEKEAERRRGVNFGGDKDGARHLLEMAGIVGDAGRSGGSMG